MNKNLFLGLLGIAFLGVYSLSMAQNDDNTAASGENEETAIMTVSQIGNIEEDSIVTLQGNLTQNLGNDTYVFTDLLADVLVYPSGEIRVADLDEVAQALEEGLLTQEQAVCCLRRLDALLKEIYAGKLPAALEDYWPA